VQIRLNTAGKTFFELFEAVSSIIFLAEHIARVWSIPEAKAYKKYSTPNRARLRYSFTLMAVLDLASCLPWFVEKMVPSQELPTLSWLKFFRLFRISKNESVFRAFSSIYRVVWYNAEILGVALLMAAMHGALGFERRFALKDAIGSNACSLEASKRVTNSIPLGSPLSYRLAL
jgi:hypothetical protein